MCVNNLPKVATQCNSGATRDSNRGRRVLISSALTTAPPSHTRNVNLTDAVYRQLQHQRRMLMQWQYRCRWLRLTAQCPSVSNSCRSPETGSSNHSLIYSVAPVCCMRLMLQLFVVCVAYRHQRRCGVEKVGKGAECCNFPTERLQMSNRGCSTF